MRQVVSIVVLIIALYLSAGPLQAQAPITAKVDRTAVFRDEQVLLTVIVSGDFMNIPEPDLSAVTDFAVVETSRSTQVSIVNGVLTSQGTFQYRLQPLHEGILQIPPIQVTIDGQLFQTDPIEIEAVAGTPALPGNPLPTVEAPDTLQGQSFFVEAEVDNPRPYLGQQIIYIFRFFQAADEPTRLLGRPDYQPPAFTNFLRPTVLSQPSDSVTIDDRSYIVTEIHTALFPANLGTLTIDPAKLVIPGGLFNPDVVLETEPIPLEVQPLPDGAPADFSGAVGQFEITTELSETTGQVNEPLTLLVTIAGSGNIEVLTEPGLPELANWRFFERQVETDTEVRGDGVYGTREFERLVVAGKPGQYTFPPINFTYYDPEAGEYKTIRSEPLEVTIEPGEVEPPPLTIVGSDRQSIELIAGDIRHIKPVPASLDRFNVSLLTNPLYWTFWVIPALAVGGVWLWQHRRQRLLTDTAYMRSQRAKRAAHKILSEASQAGAAGADPKVGFEAAHRALHGYLSDKINQPTAGLTTNNLVAVLNRQGLEPALVERIRLTLDQIETSRFAPISEAETQSLIAETDKLINDLEKAFGKRR